MGTVEIDRMLDAGYLFEVFSDNYNSELNAVTDEAMEEMSRFFGTVEESRRAAVFATFLNMLKEADIPYDATQFNY